MVTAPHALATQAGVDVLRAGGNAVDAAIAVAATLSVVYPHMCGLGGDNFWLIHAAGPAPPRAQCSGRSGERANLAFYGTRAWTGFRSGAFGRQHGARAVSGWDAATYARGHGAGICPAASVGSGHRLRPGRFSRQPGAGVLAGRGCRDHGPERATGRFSDFARTFLQARRPAPTPWEKSCVCPELGRTLECLAVDGADAFYRGPIAARIADFLQAHGGILTREDFAAHRADWVDPARALSR